ncbi:DUF3052 family protein [Mucilaginibacter psychrotolerans]|uniref:DUF3052 family protein n=1 Tax=Mucilaginibacter psychrotolerans TaxID=1524096 RepID=A0A4Y8S974_9SPHI|nr:DUF3052 family protein [Mucilaginibacter psychrotolerans]TFF34936.1 DUF3052 family protein [Mucilaginibacter psychrotolerans]
MGTAGYSSTPLAKKLGIKPGFRVKLINQPAHYFYLFTDMPPDINLIDDDATAVNLIHYFTKENNELIELLPALKQQITKDGIIWVSWPKKASKVVTDITEDKIRNYGLEIGLVDVKVCAVDEVWSGLKLVFRLRDREKRE